MNNKFKNQYRIPPARLPGHNYDQNTAYFITICTQHRHHWFWQQPEIGTLNPIGEIVHQHWLDIPRNHPYVTLGEFVVMPNHIHGILLLNLPSDNPTPDPKHINGGFSGIHNPMFNNNIPRIIRGYKGRCTFSIRKFHPNFAWQSRYHDHVIRHGDDYLRIAEYITQNPSNWLTDILHAP